MSPTARHIGFSRILVCALLLLTITAAAFAVSAPSVNFLSVQKVGVSEPLRLATDGVNYYVTDPREGGILKFSASGVLLKTIPVASPGGIAVTPSGDLVVTQGDAASVVDAGTGAVKFRLGKGAGQFKSAKGVAVDAAGYFYVVDGVDYCVQVFNASGAPVTIAAAASGKPSNSFGSFGIGATQFYRPTGITYEKSSGQLAVTDSLNGRVQFFSTSGQHQRTIGTYGSGPLLFTSPHAVAFEYSADAQPKLARMYVVDSFQSNIQVIDPTGSTTGTFLRFIGSYGPGGGQLEVPTDAILDQAAGRLVVVNGYGNLTFYGIDGGGVTSAAGGSAPTLSIDTIPIVTGTSTVIRGQVSAGATVTVNGIPAVVTGSSWYYSLTGLSQGNYLVTVTATDQAGNNTVANATITVDLKVPALTVNPVVAVTNVTTQEISGTMDAGATVAISVDTSAQAGAVSYPAPGQWKCTIIGLAEGDNHITVTASLSGVTASTQVTIKYDTALLVVSALPDGSITTLQSQNVSGTISSAIAKVTVNGNDVLVTNKKFSVPVVLDYGPNTLTVTATDRSGNTFSDVRTITLDTTKPAVAFTSPADGSLTRSSTVTVTGTVSLGGTVTVNGKPATMNGTTWSANVDLSPGLNTIEADVTGGAAVTSSGNVKRIFSQLGAMSDVATSSAKTTVTYDPIGVNLAITAPLSDVVTNNGTVQVTGYATGSGKLTLSSVLNGSSSPIAVADDGSFSFTLTLPAAGAYDLMITAADPVGNASSVVRNVVYETAAPPVDVAVTAGSPNTLSGTLAPGATIAITDKNGDPVGNVVVQNGKWTAQLPTAYDPSQQFVTVVSAAGNSSRNGDINGDGKVDIVDAVKMMRIAVGIDPPSSSTLLKGDVASTGGKKPDGKIGLEDIVVTMHKIVGLGF